MSDAPPHDHDHGHKHDWKHVSGEQQCIANPTVICPANPEAAKKSWVLQVLGTVIVAVAGAAVVFGSVVYAQAKDAADAGVREARHLELELDEHKKDSAILHRKIETEISEVQMDIRALYKYQTTGVRQARLETDGGTP